MCLAIKHPLVADGGEEASVSNEVCQYTTAKPKLKKFLKAYKFLNLSVTLTLVWLSVFEARIISFPH